MSDSRSELDELIAKLFEKKKFDLEKLPLGGLPKHRVEELDPHACPHPGMKHPEFDAEAARALNMDAYEVRRRWPRGNYSCPQCKQSVIVYASFEHYIAGDY